MKAVNPIRMGGKEVLPLIEGGKGVAISTGVSAGHWSAAGGVGTISIVNADSYDEQGNIVPQIYRTKTRRERHDELIQYAIAGGIDQVKIAREIAGPDARIHANILWEMGGSEAIISAVLDQTKNMINGVTCGAGMPFKLSEIAAKYGIHYYPIISSGRAFNALWRRSYQKHPEWLGGVVYEDPWRAGGHNGLSNSEDPFVPQDPLPRVLELRRIMRQYGLNDTPIIMAGSVWWLSEWEDWLDNPDLGPIAFQFGSRPLLTKESPIPQAWKDRLRTLKEGDVYLNQFSPTGFYSSAVKNSFLLELKERSERQVSFAKEPEGDKNVAYEYGTRGRVIYVSEADRQRIAGWESQGFTQMLLTPDNTYIFVSPDKAREIQKDQADCMGCLSMCRFSNWSQHGPEYTNGYRPDPRSFCIQKTLQAIAHASGPDADKIIDNNLMFSGVQAWRFGVDPFYANGFTPTVKELIDRILTGY
ncbi:NAD(P)H-dependent flavin oxidoreductase [Commensalibacter oyaizuii]|uniref:Nitronate monooxygenase n=1 Tax=Commensalibacter oyaizuii TaxID=3043873 RepID=A0ABT6Q1V3_9PROT|nr:nitronate monooxygenase [Commensalibacter sp. TBRC 16381]MDI2091085.1 nitronate monooxygenase [Commensalibacter sp. TBRC 16381]